VYSQISVNAKKYQDALDQIKQICLDPSKGLTEESLEIAKSRNDGSFFEDWDLFGVSFAKVTVITGVLLSGLSYWGYQYIKK
jgi:hypothetical protein